MAKYSYQFKKEVVNAYLNGEVGYKYLAEKYSITGKSMVLKWINAYKEYGDEGLMRSRKNETYTFEFKLHVVELYLTTEVSYQELALSVGMNNPPLITKWVNDFRIAGPDALRPKSKGRKKSMESSKNSHHQKQVDIRPIDTSAEHVKQLEDELLRLKIENAYLKELRRLRLEEKALLKKQRELSTASEEPSN
jgi:transposase